MLPLVMHSDFSRLNNHEQIVLGKRLHIPQWDFSTRDKQFWDSCKVARDFVMGYIISNEHKKIPKKERQERQLLVHDLVGKTTDADSICEQLLNVFLPAHEAALTKYIFFNLARNPNVYQKLRQEIRKRRQQSSRVDI